MCYKHKDGCTVHYSHWGAFEAELLDQISEETPFGSENMEPDYVNGLMAALEGLAESTGTQVAGKLTEPQDPTPVKAEPYAVVHSFEEWVDNHIDPIMHECAYWVDTTVSPWEVRAFAPIYWRDDPDYEPAGNDPRFVLYEAGEDSHSIWGGREADSFDEFSKSVKKELGIRHGDLIFPLPATQ